MSVVEIIGRNIAPPKKIIPSKRNGPNLSSCSHCKARLLGNKPVTTLNPSSGAIGMRLNIPKINVKLSKNRR